jgi:hypothetical protein
LGHKAQKGEKKMQVAEMRSALQARHDNKMGEFPNAPDWAVRYIYERRNGLSLTPIPHEVRTMSRAQRAKAIVLEHEARKKAAVTHEPDRDHARLRVAVAKLL